MYLVEVLSSTPERFAARRVGYGGERPKSRREGASVDEGGVGGGSNVLLIAKTTAAKDLVEIESVKSSTTFARRGSGGRRDRRERCRIMVDRRQQGRRQRFRRGKRCARLIRRRISNTGCIRIVVSVLKV